MFLLLAVTAPLAKTGRPWGRLPGAGPPTGSQEWGGWRVSEIGELPSGSASANLPSAPVPVVQPQRLLLGSPPWRAASRVGGWQDGFFFGSHPVTHRKLTYIGHTKPGECSTLHAGPCLYVLLLWLLLLRWAGHMQASLSQRHPAPRQAALSSPIKRSWGGWN